MLIVLFGAGFAQPVLAEPIYEVYRVAANPVQLHRGLLLAVDSDMSIAPDPLDGDLTQGSLLIKGWETEGPGDASVLHAGMLVFPASELYAIQERNKDMADLMAPLFVGSLFIALAGFIRRTTRGQPQPQYTRDRMKHGTA